MDRREFLIGSGGAAAAAVSAGSAVAAPAAARTTVPAPAVRAGARLLRLGMPWADNGRGLGDSARRLAQRVGELSGGLLRIETGTHDQDGELHHGFAHAVGEHPALAYFGGLPGALGLSPQDHAAWLAVGGGQMLWDDLAADAGVKPLLAGHTGTGAALFLREPAASPGDLAGRRLATIGLAAAVMRGLGADAVVLSPGDMKQALAEGRLDGFEFGGPLAVLSADLAGTCTAAIEPAIAAHGAAVALSVNLETWRALDASEQAMLSAAAELEFHASVAEAQAHAGFARAALQRTGVAFTSGPGDFGGAVAHIAVASVAHVAGFDARAGRIDQSFMAFRAALSRDGIA